MGKQVLPDLVPFKFSANYCNLDARCRLIITVKNQGLTPAPLSTTRVKFFKTGSIVDVPTPTIPPLSQVDLDPIPIPLKGSVNILFTIIVDAKNEIVESNKENNTVEGACINLPDCLHPQD